MNAFLYLHHGFHSKVFVHNLNGQLIRRDIQHRNPRIDKHSLDLSLSSINFIEAAFVKISSVLLTSSLPYHKASSLMVTRRGT